MRIAKALIFDARGNALILRRSGTHPHYAHEADLPGGIIERGETYEQGLVREILEEAGLSVAPDQLLYATEHSGFGRSTKRLYTVILDDQPEVTISWEHEEYEWVAPSQLVERLVSRDTYMDFVADYVRHEL
jgi:8-oxo-dGTP diphosphatase